MPAALPWRLYIGSQLPVQGRDIRGCMRTTALAAAVGMILSSVSFDGPTRTARQRRAGGVAARRSSKSSSEHVEKQMKQPVRLTCMRDIADARRIAP